VVSNIYLIALSVRANLTEELRNIVYLHCKNEGIVDMKRPQDSHPGPRIDRTRHQFLGLTQVSRTLRSEFGALYREQLQLRVDAQHIYEYLAMVIQAYSRVEGGVKTRICPIFANIILDLGPGVNDRNEYYLDILPLLQIRSKKPSFICEFDFSTEVDITHVPTDPSQPCSQFVSEVYGSLLVQDLNNILSGPKTLATVRPENNNVDAAILYLKTLGVRDARFNGGPYPVVSTPFLDLWLTTDPPWGSKREPIIHLAGLETMDFLRNAGLADVRILDVRTNCCKPEDWYKWLHPGAPR